MKLSLIWRAVLLCSVPGREAGVWEVSRPFSSHREAARWAAFLFGLGGCREWDIQSEAS